VLHRALTSRSRQKKRREGKLIPTKSMSGPAKKTAGLAKNARQAGGNYGRRMRRTIRGEFRTSDRYVRATFYMEPAVRRRSLAVRLALSFGGTPVRQPVSFRALSTGSL